MSEYNVHLTCKREVKSFNHKVYDIEYTVFLYIFLDNSLNTAMNAPPEFANVHVTG